LEILETPLSIVIDQKRLRSRGAKAMSAYQHIKIGPLKQSELEEADRIGVELKFRASLAEEREVGALSAGSMPEGVWNR
jgi:hypothetical protein